MEVNALFHFASFIARVLTMISGILFLLDGYYLNAIVMGVISALILLFIELPLRVPCPAWATRINKFTMKTIDRLVNFLTFYKP